MIKLLLIISLGMAFFSQISGLSFFSLANSFALISGWLVFFLIFLSGGIGFLGGWLSRSKKPSLSLLKIKRSALNCYQSQLIIPTLRALFRSFQAQNEIFASF